MNQPSKFHTINGPGWVVAGLGVLALLAPLLRAVDEEWLGFLLILCAMVEVYHGFRRATPEGQRAAWSGGAISLGMGLLLLHAPHFAGRALVLFLAGWFFLDGLRHLFRSARNLRQGSPGHFLSHLVSGLILITLASVLLLIENKYAGWVILAAVVYHLFASAWHIFTLPVHTALDSGDTILAHLGLPETPEMRSITHRLAEEETARAGIDRGWILAFIVTLFAIHIGRMGFDRTVLGILSPGVAVLGDLFMAMALAFIILIPAMTLWRRSSAWLERRSWAWLLQVPEERWGWTRRLVKAWLMFRLRFAMRLLQARYSAPLAISRGLQIGLPVAAIIAATVPVWGMSWYFDTENWAAGMWNSWAEERTDTWREAMVKALAAEEIKRPAAEAFSLQPSGVAGNADFSFVVIGDTGEGDASQHILRDAYLDVVHRDEVKFVVVSSDVIYPTGAMRDYELKFFLPFKGTTKPVYAIPGNHDWYDALEGFNAVFLQPDAARRAMLARVNVDKRITGTTEAHVQSLIDEASRLQREYRVPVQLQRAPFFQVQTERFALFAIDTGVARRIDEAQRFWLEQALKSASGKTKMAILGHPLYAGGHYTASDDKDFRAIHDLLRQHRVAVVMAGDTHDLEYYLEEESESAPRMHHFVNGGGGAYLSFGTSLSWPKQPPTRDWMYYPPKRDVVAKINATTPFWKRPVWWWTKKMDAWPFSAEWLSAVFDQNVAPFFQSFIEVKVEPSKNRVRLIPHGIFGRLRWSDVDVSNTLRPTENADDFIEWTVPLSGSTPLSTGAPN